MIDKFTKEQEEHLVVVRDKYLKIGLSTEPFTNQQAIDFAKRFQKELGREYTATVVMPGIIHAWYATCLLACGGDIQNQVDNLIWPAYPAQGHLCSSWLAYYDYMKFLGVKFECNSKLFDLLFESSKFGNIYSLENGFVIISQKPSKLCFKNKVLHCETGPAWEYADGTKGYSLNSVIVPQELVETKSEDLDCNKFISLQNAEVRREFIRKIGIERLCIKLGSKILDRQGTYELHEIDLKGATGKWPYLKMLNPSIGIWHMECVDKSCSTVEQALNWRNHGIGTKPVILT